MELKLCNFQYCFLVYTTLHLLCGEISSFNHLLWHYIISYDYIIILFAKQLYIFFSYAESSAMTSGSSSSDDWRSAFDSAGNARSDSFGNGHSRRYSDPSQNEAGSGSNFSGRRTPNRLPPAPPSSGSAYRYQIIHHNNSNSCILAGQVFPALCWVPFELIQCSSSLVGFVEDLPRLVYIPRNVVSWALCLRFFGSPQRSSST